jgi:hypothetical protein
MTHQQALDALRDDPHIWRYLELTAEDYPDQQMRDAWRARVIRMVSGGTEEALVVEVEVEQTYPSLWNQAKNAAAAAVGFVASGFAVVDEAEQTRRLTICHACEFFDHAQARCTKCGCSGVYKAWVASSKCPIDKW